MANEINYNVKRIDDKSVFEFFKKAESAGERSLEIANETSLQFLGHTPTIELELRSGLPWELEESDLENAPAEQFALERAALTYSCERKRNSREETSTITFSYQRSDSGNLLDQLIIRTHDAGWALSGDAEQSIIRSIHLALSPILQPVAPEDGGLIPTLSNLSASFASSYSRISEELSKATKKLNEERASQRDEISSERIALKAEIAKERAELDLVAKEKLDAEREQLESERQALDKARSLLDAGSHKDARRKQFDALQTELRETLSEPITDFQLRLNRMLVFFALLSAGVAAGTLAYASLTGGSLADALLRSPVTPISEIKDATEPDLGIVAVVRSILLSFASLSGFFGAAAWMRYFYIKDMQAQEEIRRFRNDMARASWVMEAALEIRKEHDEKIPEVWIQGVTEGLFSSKGGDKIDEGAQALAALLGLSASASFGSDGPKVELGKSGAKAVAKAARKGT